jgi:hypothetical protein
VPTNGASAPGGVRELPVGSLLAGPVAAAVGFTAWTLVLSIPGAVLFIVMASVLGSPLLIAVPLMAARSLVVLLSSHRFVAAFSMVVSAIALGFLVYYPSPPRSAAWAAAKWIQFAYLRPKLDALAQSNCKNHQDPCVTILEVDGFLSMSHGLAYDASHELALSVGAQSHRWKLAVAGTLLDGSCWTADQLLDSYFYYDSGGC